MENGDKDGQQCNPLDLSQLVIEGQSAKLRRLLESGADPNTWDKKGLSPLHHAAITGNEEIAALLLQQKADINIETKNHPHWRPIHYAIFHGRAGVENLLLASNARIDTPQLRAALREEKAPSKWER